MGRPANAESAAIQRQFDNEKCFVGKSIRRSAYDAFITRIGAAAPHDIRGNLLATSLGRAIATIAAASSLVLGSAVGASAAPSQAIASSATFGTTAHVAASTTAPRVTIQTIASPIAKIGGSATVRPSIAVVGAANVTTQTLTVKQGTKTLVFGKASAELKAGTYSVTTRIAYRAGSVSKTASKTQTLVVRDAVAVKTIPGATAPRGGTVVVAPNVAAASGAKLVSKALTVKQGTKTLVSGKPTARLKAGKYSATTTVKYQFPITTTSTVKTTTKKLVSNGATAVAMTCKVVEVWPVYSDVDPMGNPVDIEEIDLKCTGDFDGSYAGLAGRFPDTASNRASGMANQVLWFEDTVSGSAVKPVLGSTAKVTLYPFVLSARDYLYKSTTTSKQVSKTSWSPVYTTSKTQPLTIKAGK